MGRESAIFPQHDPVSGTQPLDIGAHMANDSAGFDAQAIVGERNHSQRTQDILAEEVSSPSGMHGGEGPVLTLKFRPAA